MAPWGLSREQTLELVGWRAELIGYDDHLDLDALARDDPEPCFRLFRFLFTRFSEALTLHLESRGAAFDATLTDRQLVRAILQAWPLLTTQELSPTVTVDKFFEQRWGFDRLLFTLQCIFVCTQKHHQLVSQVHGQVGTLEHVGTASASSALGPTRAGAPAEEAGFAEWMARVYEEQLRDVDVRADCEGQKIHLGPDTDATLTSLFSSASLRSADNVQQDGDGHLSLAVSFIPR